MDGKGEGKKNREAEREREGERGERQSCLSERELEKKSENKVASRKEDLPASAGGGKEWVWLVS